LASSVKDSEGPTANEINRASVQLLVQSTIIESAPSEIIEGETLGKEGNASGLVS
jgi:hypothetical protein